MSTKSTTAAKTVAAATTKAAPKARSTRGNGSPQDLHTKTPNGETRIRNPRKEVVENSKGEKVEIGDKWVRLATTDPTDLHRDMALWIQEVTGVEMSPEMVKAVQLTAVLRIEYQKSNWNRTREAYRGLEAETCDKRSEHMIQAHQEARALIEARKAREEAMAAVAAKKAAAPARRTTKAAQVAKAS